MVQLASLLSLCALSSIVSGGSSLGETKCSNDFQCLSNKCSFKKCFGGFAPVGGRCAKAGDCASDYCKRSKCKATDKEIGEQCVYDKECDSGACSDEDSECFLWWTWWRITGFVILGLVLIAVAIGFCVGCYCIMKGRQGLRPKGNQNGQLQNPKGQLQNPTAQQQPFQQQPYQQQPYQQHPQSAQKGQPQSFSNNIGASHSALTTPQPEEHSL